MDTTAGARDATMATDDVSKKNVTSGSIEFHDRLTDPLRAPVPVSETKHDEAVALMTELQAVMRKHYLQSDKMNPIDIARCCYTLANMWNGRQLRITEEKYNGKARIPRTGN